MGLEGTKDRKKHTSMSGHSTKGEGIIGNKKTLRLGKPRIKKKGKKEALNQPGTKKESRL